MSEFNYNRDYNSTAYHDASTSAVTESSLIRNVYMWMCGALVITGLTSYYVASNSGIMQMIFGNPVLFYGLIIGELVLVIGMTMAINKISALVATLLFLLYSVINGATLASIFYVYQLGTIGTAFIITAGTFGVMAVYGSITKTDLTKMGNILLMALIGIIIASVVNIFLKNSMMDLIISAIAVIIFVGLTAYDAQKIKALLQNAGTGDTAQKIAVFGALTLYLDFINLFLHILRLLGSRRD